MPVLTRKNGALLFCSACLAGSAVVASHRMSAAGPATPEPSSAPIQLAMLQEAGEISPLDFISPADEVELVESTPDADGIARNARSALEQARDAEQLAKLREMFLEAETAIENDDDEAFSLLSAGLADYPLYPYLRYQWLKRHLDEKQQVTDFLERHAGSRYASHLRKRWLKHLAVNREWESFREHYRKNGDTARECRYFTSLLRTGDREAALDGAESLWVAGKSQPDACDPLFDELMATDRFDAGLFWQRFEAALQGNQTRLARYVQKFMSGGDRETAALWLKLHRHPERHMDELFRQANNIHAPAMFAHAVYRLAGSDVSRATELWDQNIHRFEITGEQSARVQKRLAMKLAFEDDPGAYRRLAELDSPDATTRALRIRIALQAQDWPRVVDAIEDLDEAGMQEEKWQYWLARAYLETGRAEAAQTLLDDLSGRRDFYGYLAAQRLDRDYQLSDEPLAVSPGEIAGIANRQPFRVAFELMMLEREREAKLQWWHALRKLETGEIAAAAKLAQQWQWHEIAIFTVARIEHWDDIDLRFPLGYADRIHEQAVAHDIDPVILFGLIRRESAFNKEAHSPAGARGLMQLMPRTARQVARELNERWRGSNALYEPEKNLRYGSYYFRKLLDRFDGHHALALAAYNAGPHRVKEWFPDESLPADIWIETIPFRETREYVTSVLVYTMIYQQIMQTGQFTMNDLTPAVMPLSDVALNCRH